MLTVYVITLFPQMFESLKHGVIGRAQQKDILTIQTINPRDFCTDPHKTVDDTPYGGGPGMVMLYAPLKQAITHAQNQSKHATVIYLSPTGKPLNQSLINDYTHAENTQHDIILICGRYEGIDQRIIDRFVDQEISIGDYVLSGGELPAMVFIDALTRQLPGTLGAHESAQQDSFMNGLLDHPHYSKPQSIDGRNVPKELVSGHHQQIIRFRLKESLKITWQKRPDLLKRRTLNQVERSLMEELVSEQEDQYKKNALKFKPESKEDKNNVSDH